MADSGRSITALKSRLEPGIVIEAVGLAILCGLFLYWDLSRALYVLTCLFALAWLLRRRPRLPRIHWLYSLPIFALLAVYLLTLAAHGFPDRGMNMLSSRYFLLLLAVPLVSLVFTHAASHRLFWHKFLGAAFLLGALALLDILQYGKRRAEADDNAVVFGFVAVAVTCILIAGLRVIRGQRHGSWLYFGALGMGLVAILLSGSRGSWIAAVAVLFLAMLYYLDRYSLGKRIGVALLAVCLVGALSLALPQVQKRIAHMVKVMTPYLGDEQRDGFDSLSFRVESWRAAWAIGREYPLLGVGPGHFRKSLKQYVRQHPELEGLQVMKHAHNQYLQTFATSGALGLLALLALLGCHGFMFARYLAARYPEQVRSLALAGVLLVVAYTLMSLTAVPFERKKLILLYGFASASLWGALLAQLARPPRAGEARGA